LIPACVHIEDDIYVNSERSGRSKLSHGGLYVLIDVYTWKNGVDEAPPGGRGWIVQERSLSVRTLHFGADQLYWERTSSFASEVYPDGFLSGTWGRKQKGFSVQAKKGSTHAENHARITEELKWARKMAHSAYMSDFQDSLSALTIEELGLKEAFLEGLDLNVADGLAIKGLESLKKEVKEYRAGAEEFVPSPYKGMSDSQRKWCAVIEIYSACKLTFAKDKLTAISGMARILAGDMNCEYLSGLCRKELEHQILWKVSYRGKPNTEAARRVPSWPWISLDAFVELDEWDGYTRGRSVLYFFLSFTRMNLRLTTTIARLTGLLRLIMQK
jgi:hypothetical protein